MTSKEIIYLKTKEMSPNCFWMIELKWQLLQDILDKKRKVNEVSEILKVSRQSVSKWLSQYRYDGINGISPKKSWPKSWETHNRTEEWLESEKGRKLDIICDIIEVEKRENFMWKIFHEENCN